MDDQLSRISLGKNQLLRHTFMSLGNINKGLNPKRCMLGSVISPKLMVCREGNGILKGIRAKCTGLVSHGFGMPVGSPCMLYFCLVPAHFTSGWTAYLPQSWPLVLSWPTPGAISLNLVTTGSMRVPNIAVTHWSTHPETSSYPLLEAPHPR